MTEREEIVPVPTPALDQPWSAPGENGSQLPDGASHVRILGVDYLHFPSRDGGDIYLTEFGIPHRKLLLLKNWRDDEWFKTHRERLKGTSTVYRVWSKEVDGRRLNMVVKWSRVGEHVPLDTFTFNQFADTEFNSPYEEFALVQEMRHRTVGPRILTNRPLAIYVPPEQLKLWQTGRSKSKIARKKTKYRDVELDILRQYILIYEWVNGLSADEMLEDLMPDEEARNAELARLTELTATHMEENGFLVADHKPPHVILRRRKDGTLLRDRGGECAYALVDFELLHRTPEHENEVEGARRAEYLQHQMKRFSVSEEKAWPKHLHHENILNVDYAWGHAESTHGVLWVVGKDPELYDFFLPERWRHTPRRRLSGTNETYYTLSKDLINLVWKVSRVGEQPDVDPLTEQGRIALGYGYNSPFEEFSIALELSRKGIPTVYPRAIYMSGLASPEAGLYTVDESRYDSHAAQMTADNHPILRRDHTYLTVWGFWNGLDETLARKDEATCQGLDLRQAAEKNLITREESQTLLERMKGALRDAGFEDLQLKPTHFMISIDPDGKLLRNADDELLVHVCNFELLRRTAAATK